MISVYGNLTPALIREFIKIAGSENVLTDASDVEGYSLDEMPWPVQYPPQVVIKPRDAQTISKILKLANHYKIPVTPRGAGTGVSGGCTPIKGGIVLSLEKMDRVLEIDNQNFAAVVEPGVSLKKLREYAEKSGLYYPVYPGELSATLGGNVATNAGGMNAVKYGVTRHHVLGIEAVLPDGSIIESGGKYVKSSSGYDLTQLLVGSEGTLAVVTRIILKLSTKTAKREVLYIPFHNLQNAINAVPEILLLPMTPAGLEFFERDIIEILEKHTGKEIPYHEYEAFLMLIMDGDSEDEIYDYFSTVEAICKKHGAAEAMVPSGELAKRHLLEARENFFPAIKSYAPLEVVDTVVPRSEVARFVSKIKEISAEYGIPVIAYGHAGDGNVHLHPICLNIPEKEWENKIPGMMKDIYKACFSFGGAVSGEHGIGYTKKQYLALQLSEADLKIMKAVKLAFDPNNILNPGKIFDL